MSVQPQTAASSPSGARFLPLRAFDAGLGQWISRKLACGQLVVDMPAGGHLVIATPRPGPQARLSIHSRKCLLRLLVGGDLGVAESYMAGEWSSPDLTAVLRLALHGSSASGPSGGLPTTRLWNRIRHGLNRNTRAGSRRNISVHYDLGNEFFSPWLDAGMNYSSALFTTGRQTLETAQNVKLDRIWTCWS